MRRLVCGFVIRFESSFHTSKSFICILGIFSCFYSCLLNFYNKKNLSGTLPGFQTVWINSTTDVLSVLIWAQTVCKFYQQKTKVASRKEFYFQGGVITDNFTVCGVVLAVLFFPIGILCCFLMMEKRCGSCGVRYG